MRAFYEEEKLHFIKQHLKDLETLGWGTPDAKGDRIVRYIDVSFETGLFSTLVSLIRDIPSVADIDTMPKAVLNVPKGSIEFLTCDNPVIISSNFAGQSGHVALPIGPRKLFIAARSLRFLQFLNKQPIEKIVRETNRQIIDAANRYVYGRTDQQKRFISNRLGQNPASSMIERVIAQQFRRKDERCR